jgi:NADPH-ferrihemoprotein reductase
VSLRTCLSLFSDLCASPHKDTLLSLAAFASDPKEAERLRSLAANKDEYAAYIGKAQRTLLEVGTAAVVRQVLGTHMHTHARCWR